MLPGRVVVVLGCFMGFGFAPYEEQWVFELVYGYIFFLVNLLELSGLW